MDFISENIGTIITALVLGTVVIAIIVFMIKGKRKGKTVCGCDCKCCDSYNICHKIKK